ncbi:MAG: peptidoglycan-binding protein [Rhizobiales bacterium]|nr:peptidoglycan-binding protein [Hyphomicrobiales bacterium]
MYGSRNYTKETGGRDQTLDALNRTIEGLEARIEGLVGRTGDAGGYARRAERGAGYGDPLAEIRARQNQLSAGPSHRAGEGIEPRRARQQSDFRATQAPEPAQHDGLRHLAEAIAEMRRDLKSEIQESLTRELGAIRHEVRDLTTHSRDVGLPDDLNRELAGLSDRIERLGDSGGHVDSLRLELDSMRSMIEGLAREESVRSLESRWHSLEDQVSAIDMGGVRDDLVKLAYRIDDVREALSSIPASAVSGELESRIVDISGAIEELAGRTEIPADQMRQYFNALGGRLDGITRSVAALQEQQKNLAFDPESFNLLDERISAITKKLGSIEANNLASDMSGRLDQVASRLDRLADEDAVGKLDKRLAHLQSMLENGSGAGGSADHPMFPALSENIAALSGKLDRVGTHDVSEQLAYRLDDLAARIDSLQQSAPKQSDGVPDAVIGRLEALIGRVEEKASRPVDPLPGFETLEARLAEIAARLDTPPAAAPATEMHFPAFDDLEARLSDISAKLDRAGTTTGFDGDEALRNLEEQIANLSRQIASAPGAEGMERIDSRLGEIEEQLSTTDEYVIEAARQAAEAAIAAYAGRGDLAGGQAAGNMEIITALADDLKALESLSRQSEERNLRAFQGVQETLVKIAERLEMLQYPERAAGREPEREPESEKVVARAAAASTPPQMPRAETGMFDDLPADEPVWGASGRHDAETGEAHVTDPDRSPAEAAAMAAAFAAEGQAEDEDGTQGGKSFFSGLASRMRSRKGDDADMAEPRFTEEQTPPLEPSLELEEAVANTPLEPGSGAPDINRILQKVRETQARGRDAGEVEGDKSQFLASARRAAMAAAAEAETLSKSGKSGKSSKSGDGSSRRRPILMAVGAVLLVVMSLPLLSDLFSSNEAPPVAEAPAITETDPVTSQSAQNETGLPLAEDETQETAEAANGLPQVRVVDGRDVSMADAGAEADVTDADTGVEVAAEDDAVGQTVTASAEEPAETTAAESDPASDMDPMREVEQALMADLDALPEGMISPELRKAAEEINPVAFYEIGSRFTEGRGTPVDLAKAATWYQRAADLGHAPSQYRLANFYEKGSGVPRNLETAKKWYQLAAEQGNASAMHNLAVLYATAGAAPDFDSAARWFEKAAELGVRDSQVNLAILYARGDGVTRNLEESYKWFAIAANEGDKDAASKRDEVFNALRPEQTEKARELVAAWKVAPLDEAANAVDVPASWGGAETATASVDMSKAVRNIQAILNNNGYDAGQPDGIMGGKTIAAIKEFQKSEGMEPSGEITDQLVRKLLERNN